MESKRVIYRLLIVIYLALSHATGLFGSVLDTVKINSKTHLLDFHRSTKYYIDSLANYDRESIVLDQLNRVITHNYVPGAYKGGDIWGRFHLKSASSKRESFILEVGGFREVFVFYRPQESNSFYDEVTGTYVPTPLNEMADREFMNNKVKVELEPDVVYDFYVFYPDPGFDQIEPKFVISSEEEWLLGRYYKDLRRNAFYLPFVGICVILALISLIYYFIQHEKSYLRYAAYVICGMLFVAGRSGSFDFTALAQHPILYHFLPDVFFAFAIISYLLFITSFLDIKAQFPTWKKVLKVFFVYLVLTLGVTMWLIAIPKIPNTAFEVRDFLFLIIFLIIGALLIRIFRERNGLDKIFLAGTLVLVVATIASIVLDLTDRGNDIATPLFQAAMLVELAIFNIGLGVKLKFSLKARQKAQLNLIDQLKKNEALQVSINRQLEMEVQERTEEIQTQNEELVTQQEELAAQRDMLEDQNKIIAQSMNELQQIRAQLEETVGRRTAELKDANSELIQRNDQLEQYAYITAHNLRAPVARLKGLIFLFEKLGGTNSENQEIFEKISASAHEMDDVLTDMNAILEVKTSKQGRKASIKIETALDKVQKTLLQGIIDSSASLNVNLQADEIYGNQSYLESIFYNLLSNSIKYRSAKRPLQVGILTKKEKDQVIIEISDNGIGIDMQRSADKVFKLYQRFHEHSEGKGLGLYLVKTLVEAMGGHISIESKVDVGTRFKIVLPE